MLLRADDIVHDDAAPVKARVERKAFRGAEFLYTLRLDSGELVLARVPSHHDHAVGERIGIRPDVDHVVTFVPSAAGRLLVADAVQHLLHLHLVGADCASGMVSVLKSPPPLMACSAGLFTFTPLAVGHSLLPLAK